MRGAAAQLPPVPPELRDRVEGDGLWRELRSPPATGAPRPALFLDRDGTIIDEVPYISRAEEVRPIAAAMELIVRANALAVPVVVVTNQAGIGRGYFGWSEYAAVEAAIAGAVSASGGHIDALYAAPHAPAPDASLHMPYRKPEPGMLLRAVRDLNLDLGSSWIAGDCATDVEAGRRAGLPRGWLVPTGYGARDADAARALARPGFDVVVGEDLAALVARLDELVAGDA
ncbi:MAG: D-glycero-alpha-D-manno-heptose-1,7-bisphosphate 7-phosphatase [Alphaproteobacteria bacterium]